MAVPYHAPLGVLCVGGILVAFSLAGVVYAQVSDWEYLDIAIDLVGQERQPHDDGSDLLMLTLEVTNNGDGVLHEDGVSVTLRTLDGNDVLRYDRTYWTAGPMTESCPEDVRSVGAGLTKTWNVCFEIPEGAEPDFLGVIYSDPDVGHIVQFDSDQSPSCLDRFYDILCAPYALDGGVAIPDSCRFDYFGELWMCGTIQEGGAVSRPAVLDSKLRPDCARFDALGEAYDIAVTEISGRTYAFVAAPYDDGVQVIDVTDPARPTPTSSVFAGQAGFDALTNPTAITVTEISGRTYALVLALYDGGVQVIDVTDPANPAPTSSILGGSYLGVLSNPYAITTTEISGRTYALIAGRDGSGIMDVSSPARPAPVFGDFGYSSVMTNPYSWVGPDDPGYLTDVAVTSISGGTYALVTSRHYDVHTSSAADPDSSWTVESRGHDAVQIVDITDPASPVLVTRVVDGQGGFEALAAPIGIAIQEISGQTYAFVASIEDDAVQVIDVTDPASPTPASSVFDGQDGFDALDDPINIAIQEISGQTYAFVASIEDDAVQVIDVTDPASPTPASSVFDGQDGFDALDDPINIAIQEISGQTYAFVAASNIDGIQVIDVTDPASPTPTSSVFHGDIVAAAGGNAPTGTAAAGGDLVVSYRTADDPAHYGLRSWLADNEDAIIDADSVTCYLALPDDISVVFEACGEANAWYSSATGRITMCYELADRYTDTLSQYDTGSAPLTVAGALHWVFMHELGHAIIDIYDLPITGQEEDSADQFATLMLLKEGRRGAADLLSTALVYGSATGYTPYWDAHSLDYQRYYDMLCLLYGKHHNDDIGASVEHLIPESRAVRCQVSIKMR